jgi:hypothetical protein
VSCALGHPPKERRPLSFADTSAASWLLTPRFFRSPPADLEYPFDPAVTLSTSKHKNEKRKTNYPQHIKKNGCNNNNNN